MHVVRPLSLLAVALVLGLAPITPPASAAAPMTKAQAPGFHRLTVGDFEVTALSDGTMKLPILDELTNVKREDAEAALKHDFLDYPIEASVNAFLINTGDRLVLVDTGGGNDGRLGQLQANLAAAGYRAEQVDAVVITHLHGDHMGGLATATGAAFPNATLHLDEAEVGHWASEERLKSVPKQYQAYFRRAIDAVKPYRDAGRLKPFSGRTVLVPGVTAVPTHGHTPGHAIYEIESRGEKLVLWGDLMHVAAVQFTRPEVTIRFDTDSAEAMKQRQQAFADAAKAGHLVGAAHLPFPGVGHLRVARDGKGYEFVPLNYSTLK